MASELIVQTLRGPASGANANKIIVPSGQTLDASAGFVPPAGAVVQYASSKKTIGNASNSDADLRSVTVSVTGGYGTAYVLHSVSFTPKYATSIIKLELNISSVLLAATGAFGMNTFFGKDGSNLLTYGGNVDSCAFNYEGNGYVNERYHPQLATWDFVAGQTSQMTLDARIACYNSNGNLNFQHDGATVFTITEIAQ